MTIGPLQSRQVKQVFLTVKKIHKGSNKEKKQLKKPAVPAATALTVVNQQHFKLYKYGFVLKD
jgi:hypothetical protein